LKNGREFAANHPKNDKEIEKYLEMLNDYFTGKFHPYFKTFESLLAPLDAGFRNCTNTVLHTDLLSPLATDPIWTKIQQTTTRDSLGTEGVKLWHDMIKFLKPDVLLVSMAKDQLQKINFLNQDNWKVLYSVTKGEHIYEFKYQIGQMPIATGTKNFIALTGSKYHQPFDLFKNQEKAEVGKLFNDKIVAAKKAGVI
jgi:hypothetical protein